MIEGSGCGVRESLGCWSSRREETRAKVRKVARASDCLCQTRVTRWRDGAEADI